MEGTPFPKKELDEYLTTEPYSTQETDLDPAAIAEAEGLILNGDLEALAARRDRAQASFERAMKEVPTEEQLQAIIEADPNIDDELAYFTEGIRRLFETVLKGVRP